MFLFVLLLNHSKSSELGMNNSVKRTKILIMSNASYCVQTLAGSLSVTHQLRKALAKALAYLPLKLCPYAFHC